jgi:class 3 adenylate cyclase/tetratricopeptide (TPR) repeat protein
MRLASHAILNSLVYILGMTSLSREYALLCADVAEFTQAMEVREHDMGVRTMRWVEHCVGGWLRELGGRLLQQAGDAIFLAFHEADRAAMAAHRLKQDWSASAAWSNHAADGHELRIALHWGRLMRGRHGYVAHSLNVVSRLCAQVLPGQTWCSVEFWLRLPPPHRPAYEDLGTMHFKHIQQGMRVLRHKEKVDIHPSARRLNELPLPRLLVHSEADAWAESWMDRWVEALHLNRGLEVAEWAGQLQPGGTPAAMPMRNGRADFMLLRRAQPKHHVVELWAEPLPLKIRTWTLPLEAPDDSPSHDLSAELQACMNEHMASKARSQPESALSHGQLRGAALHMMHAGALPDFQRAAELLSAWSRRFNRHAQPHVWHALWHVLRHTRGLGLGDADAALWHSKQALALEPEHAHAHAVHGFAMAHLQGDIEGGMRQLEQAQTLAPDLHWTPLYRSVLWCLLDEPQRAMQEIDGAWREAPQDGTQGFALGLAGHAAVFAQQPALAIQWLEEAWGQHRHHSPVLRMLVVAHQMLGHSEMARFFLRQLLVLEPHLTARSYLARTRAGHARRVELAHWLMEAGLPMK